MTSQTVASDTLIIGGGPAGMAAACAAAESGRRVVMVDNNAAPGGQIWRGTSRDGSPAGRWFARLERANVTAIVGAQVFDGDPAARVIGAEGPGVTYALPYQTLVIATGARERFLPFPGWTVPGVVGAGGLQALAKGGLSVAGQRVIVAGSGPLLLAVASYLRRQGAAIRLIAEQAPLSKLAALGLRLWNRPGKLRQMLAFERDLLGVSFRTGCYPIAARGEERLTSVTLRQGERLWSVACDWLACGFHLVPNIELPMLLGCALARGFVAVDACQQSSIPGVYCAGEITGIGGLECSLAEGEIAGYAAAGNDAAARRISQRARHRPFADLLEKTFALRPELKALPDAATIVCRCEDVTRAQLEPHNSWRAAKLHTRCGMGPCQGKVCGPALAFLYGWEQASVRPPLFPVRVETLNSRAIQDAELPPLIDANQEEKQ